MTVSILSIHGTPQNQDVPYERYVVFIGGIIELYDLIMHISTRLADLNIQANAINFDVENFPSNFLEKAENCVCSINSIYKNYEFEAKPLENYIQEEIKKQVTQKIFLKTQRN